VGGDIMEKGLINQFQFLRSGTIRLLETTSEEKADVIPEGFSNSIHWNLGHIAVIQERVLYGLGLRQKPELSEEFISHFDMGTDPKKDGWEKTAPSLEEVKKELTRQLEQFPQTFAGKFDEELVESFKLGSVEMKTIGELFSFSLWHETLHDGVIKGLNYALKGQSK
jgi:uncharacterized damage-inducible protein DinB